MKKPPSIRAYVAIEMVLSGGMVMQITGYAYSTNISYSTVTLLVGRVAAVCRREHPVRGTEARTA